MPLYRFHELVIDSPVALPELVETAGSSGPICAVHYRTVAEDELKGAELDQKVSQQLSDNATAMVSGFDSGAEFTISLSGDHVLVRHTAEADPATIRHLLLDHALPRVLEALGFFTAHASGVAVDDRALIFLGASGYGKSSMAAGLHHVGFPLLGDDCFTLTPGNDGDVIARSTYRSLRLLPPSIEQFYGDARDVEFAAMGDGWRKVRLTASDMTEPMPMPVAGIFLISAPGHVGSPRAEKLSARDGMLALLRNSFRIDSGGVATIESSLDQAEQLVRRVPVVALHYERSFDQLELLHRTVFDAIN